jgi:hypothetical protein
MNGEKYSPDNSILFDKQTALPTMVFGASCVGENTSKTLNTDPTRQTCGLGFKNKAYISKSLKNLTTQNNVLVLVEDVQFSLNTKFGFCTTNTERAGSSEESLTIDILSGPRTQ